MDWYGTDRSEALAIAARAQASHTLTREAISEALEIVLSMLAAGKVARGIDVVDNPSFIGMATALNKFVTQGMQKAGNSSVNNYGASEQDVERMAVLALAIVLEKLFSQSEEFKSI